MSRLNRDGGATQGRGPSLDLPVLRAAQKFAEESDGAFDITIGSSGSWRDVLIDESRRVRFRRPVTIDLGGIAKGFAVDRAVEALQKAGAKSGIVNAGGDLRVFGDDAQLVQIRHPLEPGRAAGTVLLRERALATSGRYFAPALFDGRTVSRSRDDVSVTVGARELPNGRCPNENRARLARRSEVVARADTAPTRFLLETKSSGALADSQRMRRNSIRLSRRHEWFAYAVSAAVFATGAAWAWLHYLAASPNEFGGAQSGRELDVESARRCRHGGAASPRDASADACQIRLARRAKSPHWPFASESFGFLVLTGYGLYYAGGERLRAWTSAAHLWVGLALPPIMLLHVWRGKKTRPGRSLDADGLILFRAGG